MRAKCQVQIAESNDSIASDRISDTNPDDTNTQILTALNLDSSRLTAIEQRIERPEEQLQSKTGTASSKMAGLGTSTPADVKEEGDSEDDAVIPTIRFLKESKHIQTAVDQRLQERTCINKVCLSHKKVVRTESC